MGSELSVLALPLFYRALAAGVLIAALAGVLGTVVVVRRMSFFADAIAHASLAGIALGLVLQLDPLWAALGFSVIVGLGIAYLTRRSSLGLDTSIGVFYSAAVALGVVLIGTLRGVRVDLVGFLFGDILGVTNQDLVTTATLTVVVLVIFALLFRSLVRLALSRELAQVQGVRVALVDALFMVLLAVTVAVGIKLVGVVLIGPLLIMPAAAAKNISRSLVGMLGTSVLLALIGFVGGMYASAFLNTPAGPTVVLVEAVLFAATMLLRYARQP